MSKEGRTERFEDLWLPPVTTSSALPEVAAENQMCFVQDEEMIYAFERGTWKRVAPVRKTAAGDA